MKEHVVLNFDPYYVDDIHQDIFNDDIARTLYLGIRQQHLVNQYFNQNCLDIAGFARSIVGHLDGRILFSWLRGKGMVGSEEQDFADELLPYVLGAKALTWSEATATQKQTGHP